MQVAEEVFDKFDEDKNGSLPKDVILACAEGVWDQLHFGGPGLSASQRLELQRALQQTDDFVSFREFVNCYEASIHKLMAPGSRVPTAAPSPSSSAFATPLPSRPTSPRHRPPSPPAPVKFSLPGDFLTSTVDST